MSAPERRGDEGLRFYRRLLLLFPRRYREAHGEAMAEVFGDLWAQARSARGYATRIRFWLQTAIDVLTSAAFEWGAAFGAAVGLAKRDAGTQRGPTHPIWSSKPRTSGWLAADIRDALRHFRRRPMTAAVMTLVLSIGVGANSALFAVGHSVRTQPPPGIPWNASLVRIRTGRELMFSYPQISDFAQLSQQFESVAAWTDAPVVVASASESGSVNGRAIFVTEAYFGVLGITPRLGGTLPSRREPGSAVPTVISDRMWREHFESAVDVVGRTFRLNDEVVTVVGVAPPRFEGTGDLYGGEAAKVWLPLADRPRILPGAGGSNDPDSTFFRAAGRLRAGVEMEDVSPVVAQVASRTSTQSSEARRPSGPAAEVVPMLADNIQTSSYRERQFLLQGAILSGLTLLILLVTCTNVSGLLVGSAMTRRREVAVRIALGAARGRVIRQLLTESVLLALAAGTLGLLILAALLRFFGQYLIEIQVAVAWPTVAFTVGFAVLTGVLFGMSPALHATRLSVGEVLKDSGAELSHSRMRLQRGLIITQIALTQPLLVLVVALGISAYSGANRRASSELGDHIATVGFRAQMPTSSYESAQVDRELRLQELSRIQDRISAMPGIVGVVRYAGYGIAMENFHIRPADRVPEGWSGGGLRMTGEIAGPGYLAVLGIPVTLGRDFDASNPARDSASVVIGSDFAARLWGEANPIGRRLELDDETRAADASMGRIRLSEVTVIGVVDERVAGSSATDVGFRVFVGPQTRGPDPSQLRVRTIGPAAAMAGELRAAALAVSPDLPITSFTTLASELDARRREMLLVGGGAAAGGVVALMLSAIGLFALISLAVTTRKREVGIRIALGARRREVVGLFLRGALRLSGWGIVLGLPLSLIGLGATGFRTNLPQAQLSAIAAVVALGVILVASVATWIPAQRAAGASPVTALRERADEGP